MHAHIVNAQFEKEFEEHIQKLDRKGIWWPFYKQQMQRTRKQYSFNTPEKSIECF